MFISSLVFEKSLKIYKTLQSNAHVYLFLDSTRVYDGNHDVVNICMTMLNVSCYAVYQCVSWRTNTFSLPTRPMLTLCQGPCRHFPTQGRGPLAEVWTRVTWLGLDSDSSHQFDDFGLDKITKHLRLDLDLNTNDSGLDLDLSLLTWGDLMI